MHLQASAAAISLISTLLVIGTLLPSRAHAGIFGDVAGFLISITEDKSLHYEAAAGAGNLQTMPLLKPATNINPAPAIGGGDVTIVDGSALVPQEGPSGTITDIQKPKNGKVSTYIVRDGDTISSIATLFEVTPDTVRWANDIPKNGVITVGQKLIILDVTGVRHVVKKGDTLASIAKQYGGDAIEIENYNGVDDSTLTIGLEIIIPNGEVPAIPSSAKPRTTKNKISVKVAVGKEPAHDVGPQGSANEVAYYISPLAHYVETQGIHGYNAVDLAAPVGTPIRASAAGDVVVAHEGGWNGGYGSYVVISHNNGSQTLYAHMSKVATYDGDHVQQGEVIGYVGRTGLATGPHVHFEIRDGIRNPF